MHDFLNQLVMSDNRYRNATDAMKSTIITNTVTAYRRAAIGDLLKNNEGLWEAYKARIQAKGNALTGAGAKAAPKIYQQR